VLIYKTQVDRASSRSTVGTILGVSAHLRKYYAGLPVSKNLALKDGHFSSNSELGRCSTCEGRGIVSFDMQFMEDMSFPCEDCDGMKLAKFYAAISDGNYTIHQAYNTPISLLYEKLPRTPKINRILEYLKILNLDYLTLDRSLPSLSGGERLRIKFLSTLQKSLSNSLLVFTGLSYGLSEFELVKIVGLISSLSDKENTVLIIDNHPIFNDFNKIILD